MPCFPSADLTQLGADFNGFIEGLSCNSFFEVNTCYEGTKLGYLPLRYVYMSNMFVGHIFY